jgi:hypothetical protein
LPAAPAIAFMHDSEFIDRALVNPGQAATWRIMQKIACFMLAVFRLRRFLPLNFFITFKIQAWGVRSHGAAVDQAAAVPQIFPRVKGS